MNFKKKLISVVIPYYKRKKIVNQILLEIDKQAKSCNIPTEVIIVDSHTDSNFLNTDHKNIFVVKLNTLNTLSDKRNIGIENAEGEVIICIDDDCLPKSGFLKKHYQANKKSTNPEIFSGQEIISPLLKKPKSFYKFRTRNIFLADINKSKSKYQKIFQSRAMHFSFSSKFKDLIPLFDNNIKGYGWEDCLFFKKCFSKNIIISECQAEILHKLEETPEIFFKKQFLFGYWSRNSILELNFFEFKSYWLLLIKLSYLFLFFFKPLINIIYFFLYKLNYLISYKLKIYSYFLQKLIYYLSILKGAASSYQKPDSFFYGNN